MYYLCEWKITGSRSERSCKWACHDSHVSFQSSRSCRWWCTVSCSTSFKNNNQCLLFCFVFGFDWMSITTLVCRFSWAQKRQDATFLPGQISYIHRVATILLHYQFRNVKVDLSANIIHRHGWSCAGSHMVFFMLNVVEAIGVITTLKPILVVRQPS